MKRIAGGLLIFINGENADDVCYDLSAHYCFKSDHPVTMVNSDTVNYIHLIEDTLMDRLRNGSVLFLSNANEPETLSKIAESGLLIDNEGWTITINIDPKEETDNKPVMNILSHVVRDNVLENCIDIIDSFVQRSSIIEDDEVNMGINYIITCGEETNNERCI